MAAHQQQNGDTNHVNQEPDFAQVFKDLARGEQTASAIETHLDDLEKKIDELLAKAEENQQMANDRAEGSTSVTADKTRQPASTSEQSEGHA